MLGDEVQRAGGVFGRGGNQGGGGGDVEGAAGVATGTAGVHQQAALLVIQWNGCGGGAHGFHKAGELSGSLAAGGDCAQQRGEFNIRELAGENLLHQVARLLAVEDDAIFEDAFQIRLRHKRQFSVVRCWLVVVLKRSRVVGSLRRRMYASQEN